MPDGQDIGKPKKRGRPAGRDYGAPISIRLPRDMDAQLNTWIARQPEPRPSRPDAVRRILAETLGGADAGSIPIEQLNASNDE